MSYPIGTKVIATRETDHFEIGQIGKVIRSKKMLSRGGITVEFVIDDVIKTVPSSVVCWKKVKKTEKLTPQELLEVLEAHQDMLLGWIHFKDEPSHLVDVESIAVNGNAVQLEVIPFEDE